MPGNILGYIEAFTILLVLYALVFVTIGSTVTWLASVRDSLHDRHASLEDQRSEQRDRPNVLELSTQLLASLPAPEGKPAAQPHPRHHLLLQRFLCLLEEPKHRATGPFIDEKLFVHGLQYRMNSLQADQIFPLSISMSLPPSGASSRIHQHCLHALVSANHFVMSGRTLRMTLNNAVSFARWPDRLLCMQELAILQLLEPDEVLPHLEELVCGPPHEQTRRLRLHCLCLLLLTFPKECKLAQVVRHIGQYGPFECWLALAIFIAHDDELTVEFCKLTSHSAYVSAWQNARQLDTYRVLCRKQTLSHNTSPERLITALVGLLQLNTREELQRLQGLWDLIEELLPLATHHTYLRHSLLSLQSQLTDPGDERAQRLRGGLSIAPIEAEEGALSLATETGQLTITAS